MTEMFSGLWPVMLTAFKKDGSIDWGGVDSLIDFYLDGGVSGLFAVCLSSEMYDLVPAERLRLANHIVRRTNGRAPIAATGTFGDGIESQVEFARQMADVGVEAVVVLTNQFASENDGETGYRDVLEQFISATEPIALGLYECPQPFHLSLTADTVEWAANTGRFVYVKETSCDIALVKSKIAVAANTPLGIFDAHTPSAFKALQAG